MMLSEQRRHPASTNGSDAKLPAPPRDVTGAFSLISFQLMYLAMAGALSQLLKTGDSVRTIDCGRRYYCTLDSDGASSDQATLLSPPLKPSISGPKVRANPVILQMRGHNHKHDHGRGSATCSASVLCLQNIVRLCKWILCRPLASRLLARSPLTANCWSASLD